MSVTVKEPVFVVSDNVVVEENGQRGQPATFEDVVNLLGFGKYNFCFMLTMSIAMWCNIFETTNMSYIFTSAQCDLNLSLQDKGYLNSVAYGGMIISAMFWGYLGDTFGRRIILIIGFSCDALAIFGSSFSQNLVTILVWKLLGGMTINGAFACLPTYLSEFHSSQYRSKIQLYLGFMISFALTILPVLAWLILSQDWHFSFFDGYIKIHPWNIFLFITGLPAFTSAIILLLFLPESPKFLMTTGNNEKALKIFQKMYSRNTSNPPEHFPIKELVDETKGTGRSSSESRTKMQALKEGLQQMKPMFRPPYLWYLFLACAVQMCSLQSLNMLRLWTPQIFQAVEDYKITHNGTTTNLCTMIESISVVHTQEDGVCVPKTEHFTVYTNAMIVAAASMIGYTLTGTVINLLGKKKLLIILGSIGGTSCISLYFAPNGVATMALITIFTTVQNVCVCVILSFVVELFPTTLRMLAVSLMLMAARAGITAGNLAFPLLLQLGCGPPFFFVGGLCLSSALLCFLIPDTDNKPLK